MKEIYSNAADCYKLAKMLQRKLGTKMIISGTPYIEIVRGKYYSLNWDDYSDYSDYIKDTLAFYYKFCQGEFLRIMIGNDITKNTVGHKLAVLSDFYKALCIEFGEPTLFYTTKNDDEGCLNLQWSFKNREKDIQAFKSNTIFDDAEVDKLIIIGEDTTCFNGQQISDTTKKILSRRIGLPIELMPLIDENIADYIKYKYRGLLPLIDNGEIDISSENSLALERKK